MPLAPLSEWPPRRLTKPDRNDPVCTLGAAGAIAANGVYILEARGPVVANLYVATTKDYTDKDVVRWSKAMDKRLKKLASNV
jgi:hypothetical protein